MQIQISTLVYLHFLPCLHSGSIRQGDSETTDRGCVQAPALQENTNYNEKYHSRGFHEKEINVLKQRERQVKSFRTRISKNVKLIIFSAQAIWKLNLHK